MPPPSPMCERCGWSLSRHRPEGACAVRGHGDEHYTVFSLWDTYRALASPACVDRAQPHPKHDQIHASHVSGWRTVASLGTGLQLHGLHDWLPQRACHVDAKAWGIEGWDETLALEAMVQAADSMHLGLMPSPHSDTSHLNMSMKGVENLGVRLRRRLHLSYADSPWKDGTLRSGLHDVRKDGKTW